LERDSSQSASVIGKNDDGFIFQGYQFAGEAFVKSLRIPTKRSQNDQNLAASHPNNQSENPRLSKRFAKRK
jgi:hypothetical protein